MDEWLERFARANFRRSADTAHDLKTPLNVAVLNLELLRMRIAKLDAAGNDEKIAGYTRAIEAELRRLSKIFDAFFLLSTPPKDENEPGTIDVAALAAESGATDAVGPALIRAHESRIRQALKMFFDGASKVLPEEGRTVSARTADGRFEVSITGTPEGEDVELSKIFKLYYSDSLGNPDLSLATARLIAETYGGELNAVQERDKVVLRLSFPLGDQ